MYYSELQYMYMYVVYINVCYITSLYCSPGIDELPYLYRTVHLLAARWNVFSLQLGVTGQEQIQRSARATDICLALALVEWLQNGAASWRGLVEAIFRPSGGGHQVLARQITTSYRGIVLCVALFFCLFLFVTASFK